MKALSKYQTYEDFLQIANTYGECVFFDLETTGLSRKTDRILSFSAIKAKYEDDKMFHETDRLNMFINPGFHIPEKISKINHITDETVKDAPGEEEAFSIILDFIGNLPIGGYNSDTFDVPFLNNAFERVLGISLSNPAYFDIMKITKEVLRLDSYKLENVTKVCEQDKGLEFHNSIDDVIATCRIINLIMFHYNKKASNKKLKVYECSHYYKSHKVNRIYIKTYPYTKTYYDIFRGEWVTDMDDADINQVRDDVLAKYQVKDETELAKYFKSTEEKWIS
jgi:DNA polymerase III alpha subunit (gram-positive type)